MFQIGVSFHSRPEKYLCSRQRRRSATGGSRRAHSNRPRSLYLLHLCAERLFLVHKAINGVESVAVAMRQFACSKPTCATRSTKSRGPAGVLYSQWASQPQPTRSQDNIDVLSSVSSPTIVCLSVPSRVGSCCLESDVQIRFTVKLAGGGGKERELGHRDKSRVRAGRHVAFSYCYRVEDR